MWIRLFVEPADADGVYDATGQVAPTSVGQSSRGDKIYYGASQTDQTLATGDPTNDGGNGGPTANGPHVTIRAAEPFGAT